MKQEQNSGPAALVLTATVALRFYIDGATSGASRSRSSTG
jgi:hypothetical protein